MKLIPVGLLLLFCLISCGEIKPSARSNYLVNNALEENAAKVVGVHDGDFFTVLIDNRQEKIRVEGIDAPELGQVFGKRAKKELSSLIYGKSVKLNRKKQDRYGRTIAKVNVNSTTGELLNVSNEMVRRGMAWHMKKYSSSPTLAKAKTEARQTKRGLWLHPNPIDPDLYRAAKKTGWKGRSGDFKPKYLTSRAPAGATHWLNTKTNKRHNRSCRYCGKTGHGRACTASAGIACGVCGG